MSQPSRGDEPSNEDGLSAALPLILSIAVTKAITIIVLFVNVRNRESLMLTVATLLPWIGLAVLFLAAPAAWYWRLHRVRRRKAALLKAEWRLDEPATGAGQSLDATPTHRAE